MRRIIFIIIVLAVFGCKKSDNYVKPNNETESAPSSGSATDVVVAQSTKILAELPQHLAFGTEGDISQKSQYIQQADYQYQYLAGDIFTNGWATWNEPEGQFARNFIEGCFALGKIPVFTYYNIVPAKNRFEDPGFTNLQDKEVMNKYFEDWKLLLTVCNQYDKPIIIQYEPDLFGYFQMFKGDASKQKVMVASSDNKDVSKFSDDPKGLAQAIVNMRDRYAPNVLLGWQASLWATGLDLVKGKNDPNLLGLQTANYYQSLQAPFDLIFSEFSDRDSGYDQIVNGKTNTVWSMLANLTNGELSDFDRMQKFLKVINVVTRKKIILWQIPIGNDLTATCDNKRGHFQDNKAQYFLQPVLDSKDTKRLSQYADAGVIALLFGRGAKDCTGFMDNQKDGVTANGESADDDGGYLRKGVKSYYDSGVVKFQ